MTGESWVIIADGRRVGGMYAAAAAACESVTAIVAGSASLAEQVASCGFSKVVLFECPEGIPAESLAADVARYAAEAKPKLIVASEVATARIIAGAAAGACGAAVVANVTNISAQGDALVLTTEVANGKAVEDVKIAGSALAIFTGPDADCVHGTVAPIDATSISAVADKVVGIAEPEGAGLATANRVVAVGMGLASRANLAITDELAEALGAYTACTLPCSEDMHWYEPDHVVGSSHNSTTPEVYIAVGISGSPNHTSGFRDAKVSVSINNDPTAEIFNCTKYGIVGDLFEVVPALTSAIKG